VTDVPSAGKPERLDAALGGLPARKSVNARFVRPYGRVTTTATEAPMRHSLIPVLTAALLFSACGGGDETADVPSESNGESAEESAEESDGGSDQTDSGGGVVDTDPFPAISAMANLPHGVGPVGVEGECSSIGGSYRFSSSGDARFNIVILDGSPPTAESAQAMLGASVYTFVSIDTIEADADRYYISGTGSEVGREAEAGPMDFTILCRS